MQKTSGSLLEDEWFQSLQQSIFSYIDWFNSVKWSRVGDEVEEIKKFAFCFDTSLTKNKLQLLEYSKRVQTVCSVKPTKGWSLFHLGKNSEVQVKHVFKYLYSWRADANIDKVKFYGRKWF